MKDEKENNRRKEMKDNRIVLLALIVCMVIVPMAGAINISFSSINGGAERDLMIYYGNGTTLAGQYNTSSVIQANQDIMVTFKPHTTNPFENPFEWLSAAFGYVQTNATPIIIIVFLIGLFWLGRK
jgi:hypothetical protein